MKFNTNICAVCEEPKYYTFDYCEGHVNDFQHKLARLSSTEYLISACRTCPGLNEPKETMSAFGYGSLNAKLMVIGQSLHSYNPLTPDRQIPFIGSPEPNSGTLLYHLLETAGYTLKSNNLYVTNLVKCHPPENRKSSTQEKKMCSVYLKTEIDVIQPKIILTLGSDVRDYFKLPIVQTGKWASTYILSYCGKKQVFVVAYHPSYITTWNPKYGDRYCESMREAIKNAENYLKSIGDL